MSRDTDRLAQTGARLVELITGGDADEFAQVVHPDGVNLEAGHEPADARRPGPQGFLATSRWLLTAFPDLSVEIHHALAVDDLVVVHNTMRGTQAGTMVYYREDLTVGEVFPPNGGSFETTQSHWMRMRDGLVLEHWANRDDLGMARQLHWVPPTPAYLLRRRAARRAVVRRAG
ncbi:ester cyclase [Nocardioides cynanchi]|uniref:ester cyclase n=1 Tax=Nocardioides cynanchi TaxID=2558918 RepID=UPI00124810A5|nr:ester cyclase [Nocardioides cynanchi]